MLEKWRQKPATDITIFIDRCIKHHPAIFPIPDRIICTTPEERDTKWCSADNHQLSLFLCHLIQTFSTISKYTANSVPSAKKTFLSLFTAKTGKFCGQNRQILQQKPASL
jgi:hypothetical protein